MRIETNHLKVESPGRFRNDFVPIRKILVAVDFRRDVPGSELVHVTHVRVSHFTAGLDPECR